MMQLLTDQIRLKRLPVNIDKLLGIIRPHRQNNIMHMLPSLPFPKINFIPISQKFREIKEFRN